MRPVICLLLRPDWKMRGIPSGRSKLSVVLKTFCNVIKAKGYMAKHFHTRSNEALVLIAQNRRPHTHPSEENLHTYQWMQSFFFLFTNGN